MRHHLRLEILLISLFSLPLFAQDGFEELYGDEEWIAISTGTQKPIYKAPAVANVITAEDIKRIGATTLDDILETVPGLHVTFSNLRAQSIYTIRGFGNKLFNSQVLTLVNGVSIDTALVGSRPSGFHMPVANIERIEVIRGPGSAVYGADAYAGVINIITKNGESSPGTQLGLRTGSFDTHEFWLTHGSKLGEWDFYVGLDYQTTDGDDERIISSDLQTNLDRAFGTTASLAPGPLATQYEVSDIRLELSNEHWRFKLSNLDITDGGNGAGAAQALDPGMFDSTLQTADVTYNHENIADNWDFKAILSLTHMNAETDFQILPPGATITIGADGNLFTAPSPACPIVGSAPACIVTFTDGVLGNPDMEEDHYRFEAITVYDGIDNHRIRISVGTEEEELTVAEAKNFGPGVIDGTASPIDGTLTDVTGTTGIYIVNGGADRTVNFLSLQDEWTISNDWELTAGVRYDDYSDFGDTTNPRVALVWQTSYNLTSKVLYGKAFRAPSFGDQFQQNNPATIGNNMLEPETIDTFELVFDYRPTLDSQIIFNAFVYDAEDLIRFVRDATGASVAQNTLGQEGKGFEIEASTKISDNLKLYANYSHIDAEDNITNDPTADIPTDQLYLNLSWRIANKWTASAQANWIAGRERLRKNPNNVALVADTRPEIDDYTVVDFVIRHEDVVDGFDLALSVRNAFDEDARDPSAAPNPAIPDDFPLPGRNYYLEATFSF